MRLRSFDCLGRAKSSELVNALRSASTWTAAKIVSDCNAGGAACDTCKRSADVLDARDADPLLLLLQSHLQNIQSWITIENPPLASGRWSGSQFVRYGSGGFFVPHRDSSGIFEERIFTAIIYLNDDYTGGETWFEQGPCCTAPVAGKTIVFASDLVHSATPVKSGTKYIFASWLTIPQILWI